MVSKISSAITAGERQQLQRFLDRYGIAKETNSKTTFPSHFSKNGITADAVQDLIKSKGLETPKGLEGSAYAEYLKKAFYPNGVPDDGDISRSSHDKWAESVQVKLSDLAERIVKLTDEMDNLRDDLKDE